MPRITHAAVRYRGNIYTGERHCHIIHRISQELNVRPVTGEDQGFLTDAGEFLDREEGAKFAIENGQVKAEDLNPPGTLFSEDLW